MLAAQAAALLHLFSFSKTLPLPLSVLAILSLPKTQEFRTQ